MVREREKAETVVWVESSGLILVRMVGKNLALSQLLPSVRLTQAAGTPATQRELLNGQQKRSKISDVRWPLQRCYGQRQALCRNGCA
jgi:hypothetical protein